MEPTCLLLMACLGPPEVVVLREESVERPIIRAEEPLDREAVRDWYRTLAARTTKRARMPAAEAVPELVALHELIDDVPRLSADERQRMKVTLRGRIEWYAHRLRKTVVDGDREAKRGRETDKAAGGATSLAGARSLIDLIQRTINPPIWDVNGGPASVGYFAPYQALVVRAPGEIHYELGGTLGQLRNAGN